MKYRNLFAALLLSTACQQKADDGATQQTPANQHDTSNPADTGDTHDQEDSGVDDCGLAPGISIEGEPIPGQTLQLTASANHANPSFAWSATTGSITEEGGSDETWSIETEIAVHTDETHTLTLTASAEGCADETIEQSIEIGHPIHARVVVLYNPKVTGSEQVADAYASFRELSSDQLCPVHSAEEKTLDGDDLAEWLDTVQECIDAVGEWVHYIVPVYGVPYRVSDRIDRLDGGDGKVTTSLDAMLVFGDASASASHAIYNPLFRDTQYGSDGTPTPDEDSLNQEYGEYTPFGTLREELSDPYYLVARIDGADADAAMALVERTQEAEALVAAKALDGIVYVDGKMGDKPPAEDDWGSYEGGEWNMWGTRYLFEDLGWYEVVWDGNTEEFGTKPALEWCEDALYYAGWYSYNNYNDAFEWAPGAIGGHLDSCSACDIRTGSAWAANALEKGITATFGAVNEPYVGGMPEYDQFFLYLTEGATFGEAGYQSTVIGLWMMTWVGDPLYRPHPAN